MEDRDYMRLALELAERGLGWTSPNPMVGAVIVKEGRMIGRGYHRRCGDLHAEREALRNCTESPAGATLYVTLEPCCHQGRQPPCTEAILAAGIRRVVVGSGDPNPLVAGQGLEILRSRGVEVETGVLEAECLELNRVFFHFIRTGRPYVVMKYAMTLDGKIATRTGASRWITGEPARERVHRDRHRYSAILAGAGTVLADDPQLTCRMEGGRNPLRIICDSHLRIPLESRIVRTAREVPTVLAAVEAQERGTSAAEAEKRRKLEEAGCRIWTLPARAGRVDLDALMTRLGEEGVDSVLLEGGGALNWSALEQGVVRRVQAYVAPKLFGGGEAKSPVTGLGVELPGQAVRLRRMTVTPLGEDILIEGEVDRDVYGNC